MSFRCLQLQSELGCTVDIRQKKAYVVKRVSPGKEILLSYRSSYLTDGPDEKFNPTTYLLSNLFTLIPLITLHTYTEYSFKGLRLSLGMPR